MRTRAKRALVVVGLLGGMGAAGCVPPEEDEPVQAIPQAVDQPLFQPYVSIHIGTFGWPSPAAGLAVGDLNGDGRNDVVVSTDGNSISANEKQAHIFLQTAGGTLQQVAQKYLGGRPLTVAIADITGDGLPDIVASDYNNPVVSVLPQNPDGTWAMLRTYPSPNSYALRVADLNGDGRQDVVTIGWSGTSNDISVLFQNPGGGLAAPVHYSANFGGYDDLRLADVTGDGRLDIVVMSGQTYATPNLSVLAGNGDGTFGAAQTYDLGGNELGGGIGTGDLNGDGRTDLVMSYGGNRPDSRIARWLQDQGGTFGAPTSFASYDIPESVVIADVTSDGLPDVIVGHYAWARAGVYRQTAAGALQAEELYTVQGNNYFEPQGMAVSDVNGDGLPDVLFADSGNSALVILHRKNFPPALSIDTPTAGASFIAGMPVEVRWTASDDTRLTGFDVLASTNGGATFVAVPGCTGLPDSARSCTWTQPDPATSSAVVRVVARDDASNSTTASVAFTLARGTLTVMAPNGGESWYLGSTHAITWSGTVPASETINVHLSRDGGESWVLLASVPNTGSYTWTATGPATAGARFHVDWTNNTLVGDSGDGNTALVAPALALTAPNGGETWYLGTAHTITWSSNLPAGDAINLELSSDGGATWSPLASAPNTGSFDWTASGPETAGLRFRASWAAMPMVADASDGDTALVAPVLTLTAPNGGETWYLGTAHTITWSSNLPTGDSLTLELSSDGGATWSALATAPNTGAFDWTAAGPATVGARVRVSWAAGASAADASDGDFALVAPALSVLAPGTGASWPVGARRTIAWSSNLPSSDSVKIDLSRDGGATWSALAGAAPNSGSFPWTVSGPAAASARVRVTWNTLPATNSTGGAFAIVTPMVTVTSPNTNVSWNVGSVRAVTWSHNTGAGEPFRIEVSRNGGSTYVLVADVTSTSATTGSYSWTVAAPKTHNARIRITWLGTPPVADASNVNFTIK
jgi:hypothetical protein